MSSYEKFVFEQNSLVIDEEPAICYHLVSHGTDEVWDTIACPAEPEKVGEAIRAISENFPMGRHHLRLQSLTKSKVVRAQLIIPIEGRNSAVSKTSRAEDAINHSRALKANVDVSEQQLASMSARLQAEESRSDRYHAAMVEASMQQFQLLTMLQDTMLNKEEKAQREAEHAARMEAISGFVEKAAPLFLPLIAMGAQWLGTKMEEAIKKDAQKTGVEQPASKPNGASEHNVS